MSSLNLISGSSAEKMKLKLHARGSFIQSFRSWADAEKTVQLDISDKSYVFEIDLLSFSRALVSDPNDPLGLRLMLSRTDLSAIPLDQLFPFSLIDITDNQYPIPVMAGNIRTYGYVGDPDAVIG